jgi:mannosyltransferase
MRDMQRSDIALLIAVCVLAAVIRFATLGVQSFDFDESFTVGLVVNGSFGHMLRTIPKTESSPPLYYVLAWLWGKVFGLGPVGIRSLSALFGTLVVPVAFFIGKRFGSVRAGLYAALFVAVDPLLVWYSQEARTYALLALLGALSFWTFTRALERPDRSRLILWALASAAAICSHYFAGFLVIAEAVWLVAATRRPGALIASGAVLLVGLALLPLALRQADHRNEWIADLPFSSRIKEVTKKLVTGEIDPTHNWQLAIVAVIVGGAMLYALPRLRDRERRGAILALGTGVAAILMPFCLDLAGLHYLISKNVMAAVPVLLTGVAIILGAQRAPGAGIIGAGVGAALMLAITVDGAVNPALQRPDYRDAAKALGAPVAGEAVVTPNLGDQPMVLYRPGAVSMPQSGWRVREVVVIRPVVRADEPYDREATPAAPPGFTYAGRVDTKHYSLICFTSPVPRLTQRAPLLVLAAEDTPPDVQVWPSAPATTQRLTPCQAHAAVT